MEWGAWVLVAPWLAAGILARAWDRAIATTRHELRSAFRALRALKRSLREADPADLIERPNHWGCVRVAIEAGQPRIAGYVEARCDQNRRYDVCPAAPWLALPRYARRRSDSPGHQRVGGDAG